MKSRLPTLPVTVWTALAASVMSAVCVHGYDYGFAAISTASACSKIDTHHGANSGSYEAVTETNGNCEATTTLECSASNKNMFYYQDSSTVCAGKNFIIKATDTSLCHVWIKSYTTLTSVTLTGTFTNSFVCFQGVTFVGESSIQITGAEGTHFTDSYFEIHGLTVSRAPVASQTNTYDDSFIQWHSFDDPASDWFGATGTHFVIRSATITTSTGVPIIYIDTPRMKDSVFTLYGYDTSEDKAEMVIDAYSDADGADQALFHFGPSVLSLASSHFEFRYGEAEFRVNAKSSGAFVRTSSTSTAMSSTEFVIGESDFGVFLTDTPDISGSLTGNLQDQAAATLGTYAFLPADHTSPSPSVTTAVSLTDASTRFSLFHDAGGSWTDSKFVIWKSACLILSSGDSTTSLMSKAGPCDGGACFNTQVMLLDAQVHMSSLGGSVVVWRVDYESDEVTDIESSQDSLIVRCSTLSVETGGSGGDAYIAGGYDAESNYLVNLAITVDEDDATDCASPTYSVKLVMVSGSGGTVASVKADTCAANIDVTVTSTGTLTPSDTFESEEIDEVEDGCAILTATTNSSSSSSSSGGSSSSSKKSSGLSTGAIIAIAVVIPVVLIIIVVTIVAICCCCKGKNAQTTSKL